MLQRPLEVHHTAQTQGSAQSIVSVLNVRCRHKVTRQQPGAAGTARYACWPAPQHSQVLPLSSSTSRAHATHLPERAPQARQDLDLPLYVIQVLRLLLGCNSTRTAGTCMD